MRAERAARIGAEAAEARTFGMLFSNQRHRSVEADVKDIVAGFEIGVSLAVLHVRSEPADAGADRLAVLGMATDFARQGKQRKRAVEVDVLRRHALLQTGALRFFAVDRLAELHVGTE